MKLETVNLIKEFHNATGELSVINSLSFTFPESGTVAIVGRSGVGKSTLLNLLGGLERPTSGGVLFDQTDLTKLSTQQLAAFRGANVGFVFQSHHLLPEFSAFENVAMPLYIAGAADLEVQSAVTAALDQVGLSARADHRPAQLSGGEQQRVAIARALIMQPKLLLADEPTGNLDINTAAQVQELLKSTQRRLGNLMIVVTHSWELARSLDCFYELEPGGQLRACS